jgi:putative hemolysin
MTPRVDIVALDVEDDLAKNLQKVNQGRYTRMPVCRGDLGHVLGILSLPDLLEQALAGKPIELSKLVEPALYVPVTVTVMDLLEHFKRNKAELALVVDEFGEIEGLVTLNDVLEALVGDLPAADEEGGEDVVQREDGSWLIDGSVSLDRLREVLEIASPFPEEATGGYHTLAGLVITMLGRIPKVSDHFVWGGFRFEVVDMDRRRVDRILVSRQPDETIPQSAAAE